MAPTTRSNANAKTKPIKQRRSSRLAKQHPEKQKENSSPAITNDSHEQNWWKANAAKAATLINRCMEEYGWGRAETKRIHGAYCQFLLLKKEYADWDSTRFYPCLPIHRMWFLHSMMDEYDVDMSSLLGHVITYDPLSNGTRELRRKAAKEALTLQFGSYDEELWDDITVCIVDQSESQYSFLINRRTPLSDLFNCYALHTEESIKKLHFKFDGKTINGDHDIQTPMMLGIGHNGKIEANHVDKFAITFIAKGHKYYHTFIMRKTARIGKAFDHFAVHKMSTERSKLAFLSQGKRVFGYESLLMLNLKHRSSIIEVVNAEDFPLQAITNDFHEQNWWKANADKANALIECCMKEYGWDREETAHIFYAYRQFLLLKKEYIDWNANKLYPSWPVDQMCLQHMAMNKYGFDIRNLLGHAIRRTPENGIEACKMRQEATMKALKKSFGSYDRKLWNDITFYFINQGIEKMKIRLNQYESLLPYFEDYARAQKENIDKLHFTVDGKEISIDEKGLTPRRLGIAHNGIIKVDHVDKVAITIYYDKLGKGRRYHDIDRTCMMNDVFEEFASEVLDIERSKLVFLIGQKRVYGYESPVALGLKYRDTIINVVDVESYKCLNCICCKKQLDHEKIKKYAVKKEAKVEKG